MNSHDWALMGAGIVGASVALVHGALTQHLMVGPVLSGADMPFPPPMRRLIAALLQFSTINWFVSGVALCIAAVSLGPEARLCVAVLAGASYLFAAVGNFWALRRLHPGAVLYAAAVAAIAYGISGLA